MEVPNQESNNCTIKQDNKKPGNNRQILQFETSFALLCMLLRVLSTCCKLSSPYIVKGCLFSKELAV